MSRFMCYSSKYTAKQCNTSVVIFPTLIASDNVTDLEMRKGEKKLDSERRTERGGMCRVFNEGVFFLLYGLRE